MHVFTGCYNDPSVSGSALLRTHAWGAGIDMDSDHNPQGQPTTSHCMIPSAVVAIFEAEGWKWSSRFITRPVCMHFQATK